MNFFNSNFEVDKYCENDVIATLDFLNSIYGINSSHIPEIKNVIFNDPATIVFWEDGTKTVVKCQDGDKFDPEKGLAMAIVKKAYGNKGSYCNKLKKWLPKNDASSKKHMTFREEASKLHPERVKPIYVGGVLGCPRDMVKPHLDIETCPYLLRASANNCRTCWDREIPDELMDNE